MFLIFIVVISLALLFLSLYLFFSWSNGEYEDEKDVFTGKVEKGSPYFFKDLTKGLFLCLLIAVAVFGLALGIIYPINVSEIAEYEQSKVDYERALESDTLSDIEKIQIVENIIKQNKWLAKEKRIIEQWYNFAYPCKKEIRELEYIEIS